MINIFGFKARAYEWADVGRGTILAHFLQSKTTAEQDGLPLQQ
jgi:hypothetical protein